METHSLLYELPIYLPSGWKVKIQYNLLILIAPNREIANAFRVGAIQSLAATSKRLETPVVIIAAIP